VERRKRTSTLTPLTVRHGQPDDLKAAFGATAGTCESCHDDFPDALN
jgi:cytochrome c556